MTDTDAQPGTPLDRLAAAVTELVAAALAVAAASPPSPPPGPPGQGWWGSPPPLPPEPGGAVYIGPDHPGSDTYGASWQNGPGFLDGPSCVTEEEAIAWAEVQPADQILFRTDHGYEPREGIVPTGPRLHSSTKDVAEVNPPDWEDHEAWIAWARKLNPDMTAEAAAEFHRTMAPGDPPE